MSALAAKAAVEVNKDTAVNIIILRVCLMYIISTSRVCFKRLLFKNGDEHYCNDCQDNTHLILHTISKASIRRYQAKCVIHNLRFAVTRRDINVFSKRILAGTIINSKLPSAFSLQLVCCCSAQYCRGSYIRNGLVD